MRNGFWSTKDTIFWLPQMGPAMEFGGVGARKCRALLREEEGLGGDEDEDLEGAGGEGGRAVLRLEGKNWGEGKMLEANSFKLFETAPCKGHCSRSTAAP